MSRDIRGEMKDYNLAKDKAANNFETIVFPKIKDYFGFNCEYVSIESLKDDDTLSNKIRRMFSRLDNVCGVDGLVIDPRKGIKTIANRVQPMGRNFKPFNTFTVRTKRSTGTKTEYDKRLEAIREGYLYPMLTTQAYICEINESEYKLLSCGVCNTQDLYDYIESTKDIKTMQNQYDNNHFIPVDWGEFGKNYDLYIYKENDVTQSQTVYKKSTLTSWQAGY